MSQKPSKTSAVAGRLRIVLIACAFSTSWSPISPAMAQSGDMNCDGAVTVPDIPLFVDALLATGIFGGCDINRADINADTLIDGRDTQPFVAALLAPPCPAGFTLCGGVCIDTLWDGNNCGSCGNACPPGFVCENGSCVTCGEPGPCYGGQLWCDGACREVQLNPSHCGCCGHQCGPGQNCAGGVCQDAEPPGL